jgi:hypothetical protein
MLPNQFGMHSNRIGLQFTVIKFLNYGIAAFHNVCELIKARSYAYYKVSYVRIRAYDSKIIIRMIPMYDTYARALELIILLQAW